VVELLSLGYTTLRTADGRFIVVPNALAASQVSINLSSTYSPWPMTIVIRVNRDADLDATQKLAVTVANEIVGEKAVTGCFLTKVEATTAVLELRVRAPDAASRDRLRGALLERLAQRLTDAGLAMGAERPSFS
jgi:small conductance mechanosensitive channel